MPHWTDTGLCGLQTSFGAVGQPFTGLLEVTGALDLLLWPLSHYSFLFGLPVGCVVRPPPPSQLVGELHLLLSTRFSSSVI